jgi:hypothetical protein
MAHLVRKYVTYFINSELDHTWDVDLYGKLLEIGGGKERMTKYFKVSVLIPEHRTRFYVV